MNLGLHPMQKTENPGGFLSLRDVCIVLFKHKQIILTVFLLITMLSLIVPFFMTPIYEAETSLLVKIGREHMFLSEVGDHAPQMTVDLKTLVDPEIEILTSQDIIQGILKELGIPIVYPKLIDNPPEDIDPMKVAILKFEENLQVYQAEESNVITVTFQHDNPQIAAKAVNLLTDFWKKKHLAIFSTPQVPFLQEQAETYRQRLEQSETLLQVFKQEHGISSFPEQRQLYLEQRQELDTTLKSVQNQIQGLSSKIVSLTKQMKTIPKEIPLSTVNEQRRMIDEAKGELLTLQRKEQELLGKYVETSRMVVDLRKEVELIRAFIEEQEGQLGDTVTSGRNPVYQQLELELLNAESEHAALQTQHRVITEQLQDLDHQIRRLNQLQREFDELEREVSTDQENWNRYLEKVETARISEELDRKQIANVSVIQPATIPVKPVRPKKTLIFILGVFLGGLSGITLAFFLENLQAGYTRSDQASNDLGLPILVSISQKG